MTDIRRTVLWVVFTMSLVLLWDGWQKHNGHPSMFSPAPKTVSSSAPAAPASIEAFASERMVAKPGAETPTITCSLFARLTKRIATCSASAASSFGASPRMPSTVTPSQPTSV